jgi:undecaprenyl diphosphate synthase
MTLVSPHARRGRSYLPAAPHASGSRPPELPPRAIPRHVAMIMDGNGRWATQFGRPRWCGHQAGFDSIVEVTDGALELGVPHLSLFAFSTENWTRPIAEIYCVMGLLRRVLRANIQRWHAQGVRIRWSGQRERPWRSLRSELEAAEQLTRDNDRLQLAVCLNYGSRSEILDAAKKLAIDIAGGRVNPDHLREQDFTQYLYTPEMGDVDLLIRTGGDQRISNFLLWQAAYAELVFDETLWPDFDRRRLWRAVEIYAGRERRFGDVKGKSHT